MTKTNTNRMRRGMALMGAVSFTLVVLALGLGVTSMATYERKSTQTAADIIVGRNVAEAGADLAMWQLKQDPTWRCTNSPAAFTNASLSPTVADQTVTLGRYTVKPITTNADGTVSISSDGLGNGLTNGVSGKTKTIGIVAYPTGAPSIYCAGLVAKDTLTMNGNAGTDSWDSLVSTYSASSANQHGDVRVDSVAAHAVVLNGNVAIKGAAICGPNGVPSTVISKNGNVSISGGMSAASSLASWPSIPVPTGVPISEYTHKKNYLDYNGNNNIILPQGIWTMDHFSANGNSYITTTGNTTLIITGQTSINGNSKITVGLGGTLTIYAGDTFDINGNGLANTSGRPQNLMIYALPSCVTVNLNGNTSCVAATYAPNAVITINGNAGSYGSVVGKAITYNGNAKFHYDESLGAGSGSGSTGFRTKTWQEDG